MEELRPPVALLRSVSPWERVGKKIEPQRRRPPGKFQGVEASPDVFEYLADDRGPGDEPNDTHRSPQRQRSGSTSYTRRMNLANDFRRAASQGLSGRGGSGGSSSGGTRTKTSRGRAIPRWAFE